MTKEEFIAGYCERSKITREQFDAWLVAVPCTCDYANCKGWAAVENNARSIRAYDMVYGPE